MSHALYGLGGLRFWSDQEIERREAFQLHASNTIRRTLLATNPAWRFARMEGPCLSPRDQIGAAYGDDDIFVTNHKAGGDYLCLAPETTASTYAYARSMGGKLPLCVWQARKSFRRETNDGASAAKLRFNEFWQLEFQCIYAKGSSADYRCAMIKAVSPLIERHTGRSTRVVESDRLPSYSMSTLDIEVYLGGEVWREVASCSLRTDYSDETTVAEIAIGLDRIVEVTI